MGCPSGWKDLGSDWGCQDNIGCCSSTPCTDNPNKGSFESIHYTRCESPSGYTDCYYTGSSCYTSICCTTG